jgi:hypothetical protein
MGMAGQGHVPAALPQRERFSIASTRGWIGPSIGLDGCREPRPHRNSIHGLSSPSRIAIQTKLSQPTPHTHTRARVYQVSQKDPPVKQYCFYAGAKLNTNVPFARSFMPVHTMN